MTFLVALTLWIFSILLPTWDVASDISLSYTLMIPKICSWKDYVEQYMGGKLPPLNFEIGMLTSVCYTY